MPVPVITIAQMREWEKATWAGGQTEAVVIRMVSARVAQRARELTREGDEILIVAGKGHNGDDARGAQEHLAQRRVNVLNVTDPVGDLHKLKESLTNKPALVVDGLFGIGINRSLSSDWINLIQTINASRSVVLAVDVPSGLNGDTGQPEGAAIEATVTLTVGAPKQGMLQESAWPLVGRLEVTHDVGLCPCSQTSDLQWTLAEDFGKYPPRRPVASHKGTYGHLAIIAGSPGYHGAAVLTARGAQAAQPGLVTLHALPEIYQVVASQLRAVMVTPWIPESKLAGKWDAVLIGPGLASQQLPDEVKRLARFLWRDSPLPVIVDASALDWLPLGSVAKNSLRVMTPHPGEAARLLGTTTPQIQANRQAALRNVSKRFGDCWVVLKGHQTLVGRSTGEIYVNSSGNPHLAQGGSGDVLSGYIAGLLTQSELHPDPLKTLCYAVWQHGAAADRLQATRRNWVVEDLFEHLGNVVTK
jgi:NAD(P)H-hydrate epimerase